MCLGVGDPKSITGRKFIAAGLSCQLKNCGETGPKSLFLINVSGEETPFPPNCHQLIKKLQDLLLIQNSSPWLF